jgi:hypothetical protein
MADAASTASANFKPIIKNAGDTIRADDWNKIQLGLAEEISRVHEGLLEETIRLREELKRLREYVNNMGESTNLTSLSSPIGRPYRLDEVVQGEATSYETNAIGLITKQWIQVAKGVGDICAFGVTDYFEEFYYWAGAENGDKNILDIELEYIDGQVEKVGSKLYINDRSKLSSKSPENLYIEFLYAPNGSVWYKYKAKNKYPDKEVRYIKFKNINPASTPRIGDVLHLRSRIKPMNG